MAEISDYSTSASNNNSASPDGWPEGMAPSGVNNSDRELAARIKRWYNDIGGANTSGGSSNAYTLAASQTISAYASGQAFAFVANHSSTGAATLNVDSVGAKAIKKYHDQDIESGDIEANQIVVVFYQATDDVFEIINPNLDADVASASDTRPDALHKSGDYTVTTTDVDGPMCLLGVDASAGSVDIDLPTVSNLDGRLVKVYLEADPGTNDVQVFQSDGTTELWVGVEQGDFVEVTSDGTSYFVINHYEGHYARVYVSADEAVAQGTSAQVTTISEDTDIGGIWNTTNDEVDIPFDCWVDIYWSILSNRGAVMPEAKLDTTYIRDVTVMENTSEEQTGIPLAGRYSANSGQKLQLWAHDVDTDTGFDIYGDAAGDESFATIKLTRRY